MGARTLSEPSLCSLGEAMKLSVVAAAYALWLFGTELVFYWAHGPDTSALQSVVIAGLIPVALQFLLLGLNPFGLVLPVRMALIFLLIVVLSFLTNGANGQTITYMIELVFLFGVAIVAAGCPSPQLLPTMAAFFCIPNALFLLYIVATGRYVFGRLVEGGLEPNWWGLMGAWLTLSSFAYRSRALTAVCIAVGYVTMYYSSSRGSILGASVALAVIAPFYLTGLRGSRLFLALGGAAALLGVGIFLGPHLDMLSLRDAANDVMKLDDPNRGLGQGFTGRSGLWEESLALWRSSPLFGVGFRQHELYLSGHFNAHNAYLAMAADTGIVGLLWYLIFIGLSLGAALRLPEPRSRNVTTAIIIGYAVIGLFERRAINGGNPFSVFYVMCCFYALAQHQWLRALKASGISSRRQPPLTGEAMPSGGSPAA
jgi:O-antigen ligase